MVNSNRRNNRFPNKFGKPPAAPPEAHVNDNLGRTLDAVNAWGYLEEWREAEPRQINCYGPGVFRGYLPTAWAGVILWYKQRGYHHYSMLNMVGIWVIRTGGEIEADGEGIDLILGKKELVFAQPIFNAESYYRRIQTEFKTYYKDNGSPPPTDGREYSIRYNPAQRIEIRKAIEQTLKNWAQALNQP